MFAPAQRRLERMQGGMDSVSESVDVIPRDVRSSIWRRVCWDPMQRRSSMSATVVDVGARHVGGVVEMVAQRRNRGATAGAWCKRRGDVASGPSVLHALRSIHPMPAVVRRYPQASQDIREVGTAEVALTTLDRWWVDADRPRISFIKLELKARSGTF
jgi:hypothetical protein